MTSHCWFLTFWRSKTYLYIVALAIEEMASKFASYIIVRVCVFWYKGQENIFFEDTTLESASDIAVRALHTVVKKKHLKPLSLEKRFKEK